MLFCLLNRAKRTSANLPRRLLRTLGAEARERQPTAAEVDLVGELAVDHRQPRVGGAEAVHALASGRGIQRVHVTRIHKLQPLTHSSLIARTRTNLGGARVCTRRRQKRVLVAGPAVRRQRRAKVVDADRLPRGVRADALRMEALQSTASD